MRTAYVAAPDSERLDWLLFRRMTAGRMARSAKLLSKGTSGLSRKVNNLRVIQIAAQRRLQKRIDLGSRRLPCHTLELTENNPGRKLPILHCFIASTG